MKRSLMLFAGVALVAAASGVLTTVVTQRYMGGQREAMPTTIIEHARPSDLLFTNGGNESQYPDLTYAAESAVKAVVSIAPVCRPILPLLRSS